MPRVARKPPATTTTAPSSQIAEPLRVLAVPVANLHQDQANARKHGEKNLDAIKASLAKFGQRKPIVVQRDGMVVRAGNGTLAAAKALGWSEIAAVVIDDDNATASQFAIADNRSAELAEWDNETLASLLDDMDQPLQEALGFDAKDMAELMRGLTPDVTEDDVPAVPATPVTKPGDLIVLGEHRLLCGDSTKADDVAKVLGGAKPFLMVTDPPYGVSYDPTWRDEAADQLHGGACGRTGAVANDDRVDWTDAYRLFPGHVAYVWHAGRFAADLVVNLRGAEFDIRTQIIWRKSSFAISRGHYHWQHEPCWYAVRKGQTSKWCGDRSQSTVWDLGDTRAKNSDGSDRSHGTQKPVECMARPIRNHGGKDDHVYDPFLGSGTTLIACEQLGRRCFGIEIDPGYCDVIVQRWENLTGKKAVRP